jgi:hypothetical protein
MTAFASVTNEAEPTIDRGSPINRQAVPATKASVRRIKVVVFIT